MSPAAPSDAAERRRRAWRRGLSAEVLAGWLLRLKGYRILARRFSCPQGEVDLIGRRGGTVVFVEVKARAAHEAEISPHQRHRIERAALAFVQRHPEVAGCDMRFDAVFVRPRHWPRHIADAWRPGF